MITTGLNAGMRDTGVMAWQSKETHLMKENERRNAVRKSKSVGDDTGLLVWSESNRRNEETTIGNPALSIDYQNNSIETRTVKSDTCLSPTKQRNFDLGKESDRGVSKKSPGSVLGLDKQHPLHRAVADKSSCSNNGSSVLEILSGYHSTHHGRATFNLSSCFSNDDESEGSSFADDEILSLPTIVRLSVSNASMPSELTISQSLETLSPQNKPEDRRKLSHNISNMSTDVRPRPPRRKTSKTEYSVSSLSKSLVPQQIQCFPMDESPMKPSRQVSVSRLLDGSGSSLVTKVSSIDLSPKQPKRYNSNKSFDTKDSYIVQQSGLSMDSLPQQSGLSVDSSPQKPQRQESMESLTNTLYEAAVTKPKKESKPPIRKVYRSESQLQPILPALSRRLGIRAKATGLPTDECESSEF